MNSIKTRLSKLDKALLKNLSLKKIWCASSTHPGEEIICANAHINLKKKYKNFNHLYEKFYFSCKKRRY